MVAFCHRCSGHKLFWVTENFESAMSFTIIILSAFKNSKKSALPTSTISEKQESYLEFYSLFVYLPHHEFNNKTFETFGNSKNNDISVYFWCKIANGF